MSLKDSKRLEAFPDALWAGFDRSCLATGYAGDLPARVIEASNLTLEKLRGFVLAQFSADEMTEAGRDALIDPWLEHLAVSHLKSALDFSEYADIQSFVDAVFEGVRLNPVLVSLAAAWEVSDPDLQLKMLPSDSEDFRSRVVAAVSYCFVQHALIQAIADEPRLCDRESPSDEPLILEQVMSAFEEALESIEWRSQFSVFEKLKIWNLTAGMKKYLNCKLGNEKGEEFWAKKKRGKKGLTIALNILGAMYQDIWRRMDDNPRAGFELMVEPFNRLPILGLENEVTTEWIRDGKRSGLCLFAAPFPLVWNHLYHSWNLAFISTYPYSFLFYGKLLNPKVAGQNRKESTRLYFGPRIIGLYIHLHCMAFLRSNKGQEGPLLSSCEMPLFTALWGKVNREFAAEYQRRVWRVYQAEHGFRSRVRYRLKRWSAEMVWRTISATMRVRRTLRPWRPSATKRLA